MIKAFKLLEGKRAGKTVFFKKEKKDGEIGWQEQGNQNNWFITADQMEAWIELGCIEQEG